jgi:hypothetical protein
VRGTWHQFDGCRAALDSLVPQLSSSPAASSAARCVILSDVCAEATEEDGSPPVYRSTSFVIRFTPATAAGAGAADKKKKRKKKKKAKSAAAAAEQVANGESEGEEDEEAKDAAMSDAPPSTAAASKPPSAAAASSSSAAAPPATPASPYPVIDATHPYVFSFASKQLSESHRLSMAQAVESDIPVSVRGRESLFHALDNRIQGQIRNTVYEYATLVGAETARRILVTF